MRAALRPSPQPAELVTLVRALARQAEAEDYARLVNREDGHAPRRISALPQEH